MLNATQDSKQSSKVSSTIKFGGLSIFLVGTFIFGLMFAWLGFVKKPIVASSSAYVLGGAVDCSTGAIPDDGLDDRIAIQTALDTKGCADLGPGVYDIMTPVPRVALQYGMLKLEQGRNLQGQGVATKLKFHGDAGNNDWYGIWMVASSTSLHDITLDTSDLSNTEEQTHVVQVSNPADDVSISRVAFNHPQRPGEGGEPGWQAGGDCIKISGYPTSLVRLVSIKDNTFLTCDRSGVSVSGGVDGAVISGNLFADTGDQDIDFEAATEVKNVSIMNNVMLLGAAPQGAWSVAIGPTTQMVNLVFSGNVMMGRGLNLYNVQRATITDNIMIRTVNSGADAVLYIVKATEDTLIANNYFSRESSATTSGSVVVVSAHNTGKPARLIFTGNSLRSASPSVMVDAKSVSDMIFNNNRLEYTGGSWTNSAAVVVAGGTQKIESMSFVGNMIIGTLVRPLQISGAYAANGGGFGSAVVTGNITRGVTQGVYCSETTGITGPIVVANNAWPTNSCSIATAGN